MRLILTCVWAVVLAGCTLSSAKDKDLDAHGNYGYIEGKSTLSNGWEINYIRDKRTGICFAERGFNQFYNITQVACTREVEDLIKK